MDACIQRRMDGWMDGWMDDPNEASGFPKKATLVGHVTGRPG
jgi:hypothetical protein